LYCCLLVSGAAALRLTPRSNAYESNEGFSVPSRRLFGQLIASSVGIGAGFGIDGAWAVAPTEDEVAAAAKARNEEAGNMGSALLVNISVHLP
jgi:hypothetical protein